MVTQHHVNEIAYKTVGCAIEVHRILGPGLLESIYEECFRMELVTAGLTVESQLLVPVTYKEKNLGGHLRLDLLVNDLVIVELKSVDTMIPLYRAQLLTYLKLTGKPKGLLINFNCEKVVDELVPMVTEVFSLLPKK